MLLIHGISTPSIALADLAHKLVSKGCRVMLFGPFSPSSLLVEPSRSRLSWHDIEYCAFNERGNKVPPLLLLVHVENHEHSYRVSLPLAKCLDLVLKACPILPNLELRT